MNYQEIFDQVVQGHVLHIYWESMPDPYEMDMEDKEAAKKHIRAIVVATMEAIGVRDLRL